MVIDSIKIKNFRCYYGENSLSFNANGKITLIYGDSGYGKSSLLQFFKWMFYGECDFGKNDDKPLFNIAAYNERKMGENVEVAGQIDFHHLGVAYRLNKSQSWSIAIRMQNTMLQKSDWKLQVKGDDDSYHPFSGNVANQINTILPRELSKYFLLDGERSRDIVLDSNELRKAIYSLFGLDAYNEAISHIGTRNAKTSVLGHYASALAQSAPRNVGKLSISEMQESLQDLYDVIEGLKEERKKVIGLIDQKNARRDEILKVLGAAASRGNLDALIKSTQKSIMANEDRILSIQHDIGNLFYRTYPYMLLAKQASSSSAILRRKNTEYNSNYKNVFQNLKKDLLKEILEKDICVCGRSLDDESRKRINDIIDIMPPGSYIYEFNQFVAKAKTRIKNAEAQVLQYEKYLFEISCLEKENADSESLIEEKLDELKRLDDAKDLVDELEQIKNELEALSRQKAGFEGKIAQKKQVYDVSNRKLKEVLATSKISSQYKEYLDFFEQVCDLLRKERDQKEKMIRDTINKCVRDIFKKLTTQTDLDADKIQFVNDDFSLRTTYLTGGQLAVDVYSYVIGIIKALQECKIDNNENPIIVDAPFAFTGNEQSEHIFKTLPSVSKQTILLTLDLNKIRNLLSDTEKYDFYVINNITQDKATIVRGDLNAIKF